MCVTYSKLQPMQMGKREMSLLAAIASLTNLALIIFSSSLKLLPQFKQAMKSSGLASSSSSSAIDSGIAFAAAYAMSVYLFWRFCAI